MIQFDKPINLNGSELIEELESAGITVTGKPFIDGNGQFWLDIDKGNEAKAKPIVAAHNGTIVPPEPTIEQKLASVGLNLPELKNALGI